MSKKLYEINHLTKEFGENDSLTIALNDISMSIQAGELLAITGPSGCGKTTLLNILSGLIKPTSGSVLFDGDNILEWSNKEISQYRNQSIGYIMQNFGLINSMSVIKNTLLPIKKIKNRKMQKENAVNILDSLNIKSKIDSYPQELSGGQKQRVAIARALMNSPKVLLADEPTGALDRENSQKIMDIFKDLNKKGFTVIIVTHQEELAHQCRRIIKLLDGRLIDDSLIAAND